MATTVVGMRIFYSITNPSPAINAALLESILMNPANVAGTHLPIILSSYSSHLLTVNCGFLLEYHSHFQLSFLSFQLLFFPLVAVTQTLAATVPGATVLVLIPLVPTSVPTYAPSPFPTAEPSTATPTSAPSTIPTRAPTGNSQVLGTILGGIVGGMVVLGVIIGVAIYARKKERDKALKLSPLVTTVRTPKRTTVERSGEIIPSPEGKDDDDDDDIDNGAGLDRYFDIEMQLPQEQESPRRKLSSSSGVAVSLKESDEDSDRSNHSRTSTGSITERTRALITFLEDSLMVEEDDGKKEKDNLSSVVSTGTPPPPFSLLDMIYHSSYDALLTNYTIDSFNIQILPHQPNGVILGVLRHKAPTEPPMFHVK